MLISANKISLCSGIQTYFLWNNSYVSIIFWSLTIYLHSKQIIEILFMNIMKTADVRTKNSFYQFLKELMKFHTFVTFCGCLLHVSIKSNHRGCNYVLPHLKKALKRPTKNDLSVVTIQKMKFSIKDLFSKCDQIHNFLRIWSHLLTKSLMENFIFSLVCMEAPTGKSLQLYWK